MSALFLLRLMNSLRALASLHMLSFHSYEELVRDIANRNALPDDVTVGRLLTLESFGIKYPILNP
jgi:hypothetical protein